MSFLRLLPSKLFFLFLLLLNSYQDSPYLSVSHVPRRASQWRYSQDDGCRQDPSMPAMHGENYDPVFLSLQFCECVLVRVRTTDSLPRTFTKLSLFCPYGLVCQAFSGTWEEPGRKYGADVKKQSLVKTDREIKVLCLCLQRSSLLDLKRFILNTRMSLIYGLQ